MKKAIFFNNGFNWQSVTKLASKMKRFLACQLFRTSLILIFLLAFTSAFSACAKDEKAVMEAYEFRMNGKVDQAVELLETILKEDSTNAMAHFEMARTLNYMNLMGSKEADQHLQKALEYDSTNLVYMYYNAKNCFLKAYIALQQDESKAKSLVENSCNEFLRVLEQKADYPEALMYLVEFYGVLPEDLGGDKIKAEEYTQQLEKVDKFYGAKARLVMLPEGTDRVKYWEDYMAKHGENCNALKELGVANIFSGNVDAAANCFEKAINLNEFQNIRYLDLARFHMMKVMQNREAANEELPKSKVYIDKYLASTPQPITPLKAYAFGMLAKTEMFLGNRENGQKIIQEAKLLDPYFSRAFGIPSLAVFEAPDKIDHHFQSYFSPY